MQNVALFLLVSSEMGHESMFTPGIMVTLTSDAEGNHSFKLSSISPVKALSLVLFSCTLFIVAILSQPLRECIFLKLAKRLERNGSLGII